LPSSTNKDMFGRAPAPKKKKVDSELEQAELAFVAPPAPSSRRQNHFCGSHMLQGGATLPLKHLVGLQLELPQELERARALPNKS
jgi:hypothetical protein